MIDDFGKPVTPSAARRHWPAFLLEGIALILLGALAIALPLFAGLAIAVLVGWLILVGGVIGLGTTLWARHAPGFWWSLLSAVLWIGAGGALVVFPIAGLVYLTALLIVWFILEGIAMILYALSHRKDASPRWAWMLVSGIVALILGVVLAAGLPGIAAWALGLLVGINLVFSGLSLIAVALIGRR